MPSCKSSATASLDNYIKNFESKSSTKSSSKRKSKCPSVVRIIDEKPKYETSSNTNTLMGVDYDLIEASLTQPIDQIEKLIKTLSFRMNEFRTEMILIDPKRSHKSTSKSPASSSGNNEKENMDKFSTVKLRDEDRDPVLESLGKFQELNKLMLQNMGKQNIDTDFKI